jgi:hypothetical protein
VSLPTDPEQNPPAAEPAPLPRIGDAERDRAVGYLQEHMAQGRLDNVEFDERLTRALSARTEADLQPLFEDLPEPRPGSAPATPAPYTPPPWVSSTSPAVAHQPSAPPLPSAGAEPQLPRAAMIVLAVVWPVAILLSVLGHAGWWVWVAAALVSYGVRRGFATQRPPRDQQGPPTLDR